MTSRLLHLLAVAGLATCSAATARTQSVIPVTHLDAERFTGTWYEVARLPNKAEKKCIGTPLALYARGDKPLRLQVVDSCPVKDGSTNIRNASGRFSKAGDGKLKVTYTFPFSTRQWVLATAPDYQWAVIGSPNHKALWILARTPNLPAQSLDEARSAAIAQGYNLRKLLSAPPKP